MSCYLQGCEATDFIKPKKEKLTCYQCGKPLKPFYKTVFVKESPKDNGFNAPVCIPCYGYLGGEDVY